MSKHTQEPPKQGGNGWIKWVIVAFLFGLYYYLCSQAEKLWKEKKSKSTYAKEYGVDEDTFLKWMRHFSPQDIVDEYINTAVKKIPSTAVYQYLGDAPTDGIAKGKADLAAACCVSRNTLLRHFKKIAAFENEIGISIDDYKTWRVFPPLVFTYLVQLHEKHYSRKAESPVLT